MIPNLTKQQTYDTAASVAKQLDADFDRVRQFKAWLDTVTDATFIGLGAAQPDLDVLRSAIADLDQLRAIYQGSGVLLLVKDFRTFAKLTYAYGSQF